MSFEPGDPVTAEHTSGRKVAGTFVSSGRNDSGMAYVVIEGENGEIHELYSADEEWVVNHIYHPGDRLLAVHDIWGALEGTYEGWGIKDDGTRYARIWLDDGSRRELPVRLRGESGGYVFHLVNRGDAPAS
jgi:hypothetical protein